MYVHRARQLCLAEEVASAVTEGACSSKIYTAGSRERKEPAFSNENLSFAAELHTAVAAAQRIGITSSLQLKEVSTVLLQHCHTSSAVYVHPKNARLSCKETSRLCACMQQGKDRAAAPAKEERGGVPEEKKRKMTAAAIKRATS